ncbi:Protein TRI1, partial [Tetrabaena socialis]
VPIMLKSERCNLHEASTEQEATNLETDYAPRRAAKASGEKRPKEGKAAKAAKEPKAAPKSKRAKQSDAAAEEEEEEEEGGEDAAAPKKPSNFSKPLQLDAVMSEWTGQEAMSRAQLTAYFWTYVKENGLQVRAGRRCSTGGPRRGPGIMSAEVPSSSAPCDEQIIERLRALLAKSDLQTTTEKMLRKKLEEEFQMELLDKKPMIRQEVERYLAEQGDEEEEDEEEDGENAAPRGSSLGSWLSEPLQAFLGEESLPRTQVVKRLWEYIRANNLQDPRDKRKILLDAKLKTLFTSPLTMFSMNTQLSRHCKTLGGWAPGLCDPTNKSYILCDAKLLAVTGEPRIRGFSFAKCVNAHVVKS